MKIQGTRSASAALALSRKSVGDSSGRNRPPVCGDDWSLENPFAGFGYRASPFFDVDNSGSPSNRPPATNFSATACAMLNSEKKRSRKPSSSSNPRWTEGAAAAGSLSGRHGATYSAVKRAGACTAEVRGSNPLSSTRKSAQIDVISYATG